MYSSQNQNNTKRFDKIIIIIHAYLHVQVLFLMDNTNTNITVVLYSWFAIIEPLGFNTDTVFQPICPPNVDSSYDSGPESMYS